MNLLISIVAPLRDEEACLNEFFNLLKGTLESMRVKYEIIFVDDGSTDRSTEILKDLRRRDMGVKIVSFSRNFGHQVAVKAGIDHSSGDAVIIMDT
ncbi:MAG: glycosyltransferase, partial [Candidatus Aureabacteria bacterium]|nr:glycosyltransferase [Candidatus Auribacterota bacterium]